MCNPRILIFKNDYTLVNRFDCGGMLKNLRNFDFWVALALIVISIGLMIADNLRLIHLGFFVGPFRANHWFVWVGTVYVAFSVPIIAILKQKYESKRIVLSRVHMYGNLIAFLLVSLHFAGQLDRPATAYPALGTGLALYIVMILFVVTGFIPAFDLFPKVTRQTRRFLHINLIFAFYIVIIIHILHGLGVI